MLVILNTEESEELLQREDIAVHDSPYAYLAYADTSREVAAAELVQSYYNCPCKFLGR